MASRRFEQRGRPLCCGASPGSRRAQNRSLRLKTRCGSGMSHASTSNRHGQRPRLATTLRESSKSRTQRAWRDRPSADAGGPFEHSQKIDRNDNDAGHQATRCLGAQGTWAGRTSPLRKARLVLRRVWEQAPARRQGARDPQHLHVARPHGGVGRRILYSGGRDRQ
jgi:hypothetical protein